MKLRQAKGKVPIYLRWEQGSPICLIDFPSWEVFHSLYSHQTHLANREKYWTVVKHLASGKSRRECGDIVGLSQSQIAKIECRFLRLMGQWFYRDLEANLLKLTLSHEALLSFLETEMPENSLHADDSH